MARPSLGNIRIYIYIYTYIGADEAANRKYFIAEGTLLSTARDGFIVPWDGDADIVFDTRNESGQVAC